MRGVDFHNLFLFQFEKDWDQMVFSLWIILNPHHHTLLGFWIRFIFSFQICSHHCCFLAWWDSLIEFSFTLSFLLRILLQYWLGIVTVSNTFFLVKTFHYNWIVYHYIFQVKFYVDGQWLPCTWQSNQMYWDHSNDHLNHFGFENKWSWLWFWAWWHLFHLAWRIRTSHHWRNYESLQSSLWYYIWDICLL